MPFAQQKALSLCNGCDAHIAIVCLPTNSSLFALALTDAWCNSPAHKLYIDSAKQVALQVCQHGTSARIE